MNSVGYPEVRTKLFQSTLPARGATSCRRCFARAHRISIHAPRTGSDAFQPFPRSCHIISIHAPRTGSDTNHSLGSHSSTFQSTLPARGATYSMYCRICQEAFQSTLPARGATKCRQNAGKMQKFQSTLPARGATVTATRRNHFRQYFNPRSPHGERPDGNFVYCIVCEFQSTLPARGATGGAFSTSFIKAFQSTLPARGATFDNVTVVLPLSISIHAPRTGSDSQFAPPCQMGRHFNPRSPHGERRLPPTPLR